MRKCADCGGPAKVYDWLSKSWWCVTHWTQLLADYRSAK